jgi:hypothetical protein
MREWLSGRNPVFEALSAGRRNFFRLRIAQGVQETGRLQEIISLCRHRKLPVERTRSDSTLCFGQPGGSPGASGIPTAICLTFSGWLQPARASLY